MDVPNDDETGILTGLWHRYLTITSTDEGNPVNKLSPFVIHKGIKGIAGGDATIKRQSLGYIDLTCSQNPNQLIYSSVFCLLVLSLVVVTPHKSLHCSKGVVRNCTMFNTQIALTKYRFRRSNSYNNPILTRSRCSRNLIYILTNLCAQFLHKTATFVYTRYRPLVASYDIPG